MLEASGPSLAPRELQVLKHMAAGGTYAAVGREMGISHNTAEWYGKQVMAKLGARTITQAVYMACQRGLLPMQTPGTKAGEIRIGPSLRLLRSLMAEGFSVSFIAARMGMGQSELSLLMNRMWVTTAMDRRIRLAFLDLAGRDPLALGVHQRGYTRARNRARVEGWEVVSAAEVQQMRTAVPHAA